MNIHIERTSCAERASYYVIIEQGLGLGSEVEIFCFAVCLQFHVYKKTSKMVFFEVCGPNEAMVVSGKSIHNIC